VEVCCQLTVNSGMPHFETMLLRSMIIWLLSTAYDICCTPNTSLQAQTAIREQEIGFFSETATCLDSIMRVCDHVRQCMHCELAAAQWRAPMDYNCVTAKVIRKPLPE
jgi:hypothetical protein